MFEETEKRKENKYIFIVILTILFTISSSLHFVPVDSGYHLVSFPCASTALFPPTSFVLLLANVLHFYMIQTQQCNYIHVILTALLFKSVKGKKEKRHAFMLFYNCVISFTGALLLLCVNLN